MAKPACSPPPIDPVADRPTSVQLRRVLGAGRAATARLVDATFENGRTCCCVEKVFSPGRLTQTIYRLGFQSPFAYQSNRDAILACFYRRRVAAGVLSTTDLDVSVAQPTYVRFDEATRSWVLAAEWIDGRGIRPAPYESGRLKRIRTKANVRIDEVDELVARMKVLENLLRQSGLTGSGWQVAPGALVSTANLLRTQQGYTIVDLESGIPAVLVGRYLWSGIRQLSLPPFDDLDSKQLVQWYEQHHNLLTFRIGPEATKQLRTDIDSLIYHSEQWKQSEMAVARRPWRHFTKVGTEAYQRECRRRWQQDGVVDGETARELEQRPFLSRAIWWSSCLPSKFGRVASRYLGNRSYRHQTHQWIQHRDYRRNCVLQWAQRTNQRLIDQRRIESAKKPLRLLIHRMLATVTSPLVHRFLTQRKARADMVTRSVLLLMSRRYQMWIGERSIENAINQWSDRHRISPEEAEDLRSKLRSDEILAYCRGFGLHLVLKAFAPIVIPAKVGGVAAFIASGNLWFLLPILFTPMFRSALTLFNAWSFRKNGISHREALISGLLPVVGSIAFPLQMFSTRPELSIFLIRDLASRLACKIPIYGGHDSRTEIELIRCTDYLISVMVLVTRGIESRSRSINAASESTERFVSTPRTILGRWLEREAIKRMEQSDSRPDNGDLRRKAA